MDSEANSIWHKVVRGRRELGRLGPVQLVYTGMRVGTFMRGAKQMVRPEDKGIGKCLTRSKLGM